MKINNFNMTENWLVSFELCIEKKELEKFYGDAEKRNGNQVKNNKKQLEKSDQEQFQETIAALAIPEYMIQAYKEKQVYPVSKPFHVVIRQDLECIEVRTSFYTYPVLTEIDYNSLCVEREIRKCTESDIDQAVERYMDVHLYVHKVGREVRKGDLVNLAFDGTCEGRAFPFNHSSGMRYTVGKNDLFCGIDHVLLGMRAGEEKYVQLTMPENFQREAVAGKTVDLYLKVLEVFGCDRLECTEQYVKEHVSGCNTMAEFRELQRKAIQRSYDIAGEQKFRQKLRKALATAVACPIPESMVEKQLEEYAAVLNGMAAAEHKTLEQVLKEEGKTLKQFFTESRADAEEKVRISIVADFIARDRRMRVTEQELKAELERLAKQSRITVDQVLKNGDLERIREKILQDKVYAYVYQCACDKHF